MTLERAAENLDSLRRAHKLNSVLSFATFDGRFGTHGGVWVAAVCDRRSLHQEQDYCGYGRLRLPCLLNHLSNKKHRSIVSDLRASAGYPNVNDLTEVGAHPYRQLELLREWINRHVQFGFAKPGSLGDGTFSGSDFVIIWFDSQNGLQIMANKGTQCLALSLHLVRVCLKSIKC